MTTLGVILLLSLVVASLTAAATTVRMVSRIWLRHWTERRLSGAHTLAPMAERPQRLLLAAGTGIAATVFAMGALIGLREDGGALVRYLLLAAVLLLVLGQLVPRAIARRWSAPLAPLLLPAMHALDWLSAPLLSFAERLARRFSVSVATAAPQDPDALGELLREGEIEGVGEPGESAIISGVAEFGEKRVREIMTVRADVVAVERRTPAPEIARIVAQSKFSRVPVYEERIENAVGLVHSLDVLAHPEAPVAALRPLAAARDDEECHALMRRMLRERVYLAMVSNAAGTTVGLVTLEDLVEELVGEISDEHDEASPGAA